MSNLSATIEPTGHAAPTSEDAMDTVTRTGSETLSMNKAINAALADVLAENPRALVLGEDVGQLGGVFRITDGLQKRFGADRVFDTPLAESGILGMSVGLAMAGYHPIPEVQFDGFTYPAINQIVTQMARMNSVSYTHLTLPTILRV